MTNYFKQHPPSHGGNIFEKAKLLNVQVEELIDASASLVPFPLPKELRKSLIHAINGPYIKHYPDRSYKELRTAISNFHELDYNMILPGNGASELFNWIAKDASLHGLNALPSPCFSDYARSLNCWNANYIEIPLPLSWSNKKPQNFPLETNANVIWITNPHNPTGQLWSRSSIERFLKEQKMVICDEAFLPLVPNGEQESMIPLTKKYSNLIVVRSLTKLYSIAGIRLGYAITSSKRISQWEVWRDPWPVNALSVIAGTTIFNDHSNLEIWINKVQTWVTKEGKRMQSELQKFKYFHTLPSSSNFLLIKSNISLINLKDNMEKNNIIIRDCRSFDRLGENFLRISLQSRENNLRIINNLKKLVN